MRESLDCSDGDSGTFFLSVGGEKIRSAVLTAAFLQTFTKAAARV